MVKVTILDSNAIICATAMSGGAYLLTNDSKLKALKDLKVKNFITDLDDK